MILGVKIDMVLPTLNAIAVAGRLLFLLSILVSVCRATREPTAKLSPNVLIYANHVQIHIVAIFAILGQ